MNELARALVAAIAEDPAALAQLREVLRDDTDCQEQATRAGAYTVATLAAELGRTPRAIRGAIHRRELAAVKRGGQWVIAGDAVTAWAAPRAAPARPRQTPPRLAAPAAAGPSLRDVFGELKGAS